MPLPAYTRHGWQDKNPLYHLAAEDFEKFGEHLAAYFNEGLRPGAYAGPVRISKAVSGSEDQAPRLQEEIDALAAQGGGRLVPADPSVQYRLTSTTQRNHTKANVPGETAGKVTAALHIPASVCLGYGAGTPQSFRFNCNTAAWTPQTFAGHLTGEGGSGISLGPCLDGVYFTTVAATPSNYKSIATPPNDPRVLFCDNGFIRNVWIAGKWRAGQYMVGDHFVTENYWAGGFAAVERGNSITAGDDSWWNSRLQGDRCGVLITSEGEAFTAHSFHRCHFGASGLAPFFAPSMPSSGVFLQGLKFFRCSFESMVRGLFTDATKTGKIEDIDFYGSGMQEPFSGFNPAPTDVAYNTLPIGGVIQCGTLQRLFVHGSWAMFESPGFDAAKGCLIDVGSFARDCDLGDISGALAAAQNHGVPMIRGSARNVRGRAVGTNSERQVDLTFIKTATACNKGDTIRQEKSYEGRLFDSAGKPALVAYKQGEAGEIVPAVKAGEHFETVARVGHGELASPGVTLPIAAATAKGTIATPVDLGTGAAVSRLIENGANISGTVARIVPGSDLPTGGGTISLSRGGTTIYTYTSITTDATTGVPQLNGLSPAITEAKKGGDPIGRVVTLTESASAAGFSSSGGVAKAGSTYFTYQGISGNSLVGVSNGEGVIEGTVEAVNAIALSGQVARDFPTTNGSAAIAEKTNPGQFKYEKVLSDKLTNDTEGKLTYLANVTGQLNAGTYGTKVWVYGGTRLNGKQTLGGATLTVKSTAGFPSKGTLCVNGNQTVVYTGKTATTFTGCTGGSGEVADESIVTLFYGKRVEAGRFVRPGFTNEATDEYDKGIVNAASSSADPLGVTLGYAVEGDKGSVVLVDAGPVN